MGRLFEPARLPAHAINGPRLLASIALVLTILAPTSPGAAELPMALTISQQQPPSELDWWLFYLRRQLKNPDACGPRAVIEPAELIYLAVCDPIIDCNGQVWYEQFGKPHLYGIVHPGPYYIKEARIGLIDEHGQPMDFPTWSRATSMATYP